MAESRYELNVGEFAPTCPDHREEARMERNVSIVRSDLAYAAGLRIPLVTAR